MCMHKPSYHNDIGELNLTEGIALISVSEHI